MSARNPSSRSLGTLAAVFTIGLLTPVLWAYLTQRGQEPLNVQLGNPATWQRLASPGALSTAHRALACDACHTAVVGIERSKCVTCHANAASLLQRQPTAFHADIMQCADCHREHQGASAPPVQMDHEALSKIGLRELREETVADPENRLAKLEARLRSSASGSRSRLTPAEALLDCARCHRNDDRHFNLFGSNCGDCHRTSGWNLPAFQHPSSNSRDCAQCHQAPPSHYMMHFKMVSKRVSGKPHADVRQCFVCHQTTSWPDIQDVGFYKHH